MQLMIKYQWKETEMAQVVVRLSIESHGHIFADASDKVTPLVRATCPRFCMPRVRFSPASGTLHDFTRHGCCCCYCCCGCGCCCGGCTSPMISRILLLLLLLLLLVHATVTAAFSMAVTVADWRSDNLVVDLVGLVDGVDDLFPISGCFGRILECFRLFGSFNECRVFVLFFIGVDRKGHNHSDNACPKQKDPLRLHPETDVVAKISCLPKKRKLKEKKEQMSVKKAKCLRGN